MEKTFQDIRDDFGKDIAVWGPEYINYLEDRILATLNNAASSQVIIDRIYTKVELKTICNDVMNLGMSLRQSQLNATDGRSGKEVLNDYLEKLG